MADPSPWARYPDQTGIPVVSNAFVVIRPGAVLDASGASATLDLPSSSGGFTSTLIATDGGTIGLYSGSGVYIDGALRAASGGPGAAGGELDVANMSQTVSPNPPNPLAPFAIGVVPTADEALRTITLVQNQQPSGLSVDAQAGVADPSLVFGQATLSVQQVKAGGFGSLGLYTRDLLQFEGNVNLSLPVSLHISGPVIAAAVDTPDITVNLSAPYVRIDGYDGDDTISSAYYSGLQHDPRSEPQHQQRQQHHHLRKSHRPVRGCPLRRSRAPGQRVSQLHGPEHLRTRSDEPR